MEIVLPEKSYEIIVKRHGLDSVGDWIASLWKNKKIAIISDEHVFPIYGEKMKSVIMLYQLERAVNRWIWQTNFMNF